MKILGGGVTTRPGQWGASCLFFSIDGINIVVDCGVRLNTCESILPNLEWLKEKQVDALFITHGHTDHVGAAPLLAAQHPEAEICMTFQTAEIARILLASNLELAEKLKHVSIFSREEYEKFFERVMLVDFAEWQTLEKRGRQIQFCFWHAGHVRGASSILVKDSQGNHLMITGDISLQAMPTVEAAKPLPTEFVNNKLTLVTEATNGGITLPDRVAEEQRLVERTREVNARGGHVLIPAFSTGRAQDVAFVLTQAGIPVWIGGMANSILHSDAFGPSFVHQLMNRLNCNLDLFAGSNRPKVVVTTHGMLAGGQSRELAYQWIENPKNAIFIPGYQAYGTLGRKILNAKAGKEIFFLEKNDRRKAQASIERFRLSSHSDGSQLTKWIGSVNPQKVFVVHAEMSGATGLRKRLRNHGFQNPILEAYNENVCSL